MEKSKILKLSFIMMIFFRIGTYSDQKFINIGGFVIPETGYGVWGGYAALDHSKQFENYISYSSELSLWVGAILEEGKILVTTGDGHAPDYREEWSPNFLIENKIKEVNADKNHTIIKTYFNDLQVFKGHTPLGLEVESNINKFENKNFYIMEFKIRSTGSDKILKDVYIGLKTQFDIPDDNYRYNVSEKQFAVIQDIKAFYLYNNTQEEKNCQLIGILSLDNDYKISTFYNTKEVITDEEKYTMLSKGNEKESNSGDCFGLISSGPFDLENNDVISFSIAVIQVNGIENFKETTNKIINEYKNNLKKNCFDNKAVSLNDNKNNLLLSNYPNPFSNETKIQYIIKNETMVDINIYNLIGEKIKTLLFRKKLIGKHEIIWDGTDNNNKQVSNGIYFCQVRTDNEKKSLKIMYLK